MRKGSKMTEEQKKKSSEAKRKLWANPEYRAKMGQIRKKHFETNTIWNKGIPMSEESKKKLSESIKKSHIRPEIKKKMSKAQKKLWSDLSHREKMVKAHKGFKVSEKTKEKLREINKGKKMSPEAIRKMVEKRMKNGTYRPSKETRIKIGLAGKGRPAWNKGVNFPKESKRKEWQIKVASLSRKRLLKMYESGKFPVQTNTKPERKIKKELIKRGHKEGIDFIHQYKLMNKFMCDFCFPLHKLIIEVDGDFWHANPIKYPNGENLHPHQIKGIKKDKAKTAYINKIDNGSWTLLRFWEMDIQKDVAKCVDEIEETIRGLPS